MIKIVVLNRGWVVVGKTTETNGGDVIIEGASVIRRWGTERGLGQIAKDGPTSSTILDPTPRQSFPKSCMIFSMDCTEDKWSEHCSH